MTREQGIGKDVEVVIQPKGRYYSGLEKEENHKKVQSLGRGMNLEPDEYETETLNTQHSCEVKMVQKHSKEDCDFYMLGIINISATHCHTKHKSPNIKSHCKNKTGHYTSF